MHMICFDRAWRDNFIGFARTGRGMGYGYASPALAGREWYSREFLFDIWTGWTTNIGVQGHSFHSYYNMP